MSTWAIIVLVAVIVAGLIAIGVSIYYRQRGDRLRRRFGPEYDRLVGMKGDRRLAEAELDARASRVQAMRLRELEPRDRARIADAWRAAQARFVDDPRGAVAQAEPLVGETMRARGYPLEGFEQCEADLSVTHPQLVQHYRAAHEAGLRAEGGPAGTETLRQAMIEYRTLFEDLLGPATGGPMEVEHGRAA